MAIIHRVRAVSSGWQGAPGLNTFYFREGIGSVADGAVAQLGADRVHAAFTAAAALYTTVTLIQVDPSVDAINDATGELVASFGVTAPALIGGSNTGGFNGIALMLLSTYRTGGVVNGHRVAGRSYLGPLAEGGDTNGTPTNAQGVLVGQFGAALLNKGPTGPDVVVWSRPFPGRLTPLPTQPARAGSSHVITSVGSTDFFAVLRSRRD